MTGGAAGRVDLESLFASIDEMDTERFLGFIGEDCTFRFGSSPPITGREGIRASVNDFFSMFAALRHELDRVVADDASIVCEGTVTYTKHDGSKITLPFCNVFEDHAGLITLYRIYIDMTPLYAG